jgi:hypothetical protein
MRKGNASPLVLPPRGSAGRTAGMWVPPTTLCRAPCPPPLSPLLPAAHSLSHRTPRLPPAPPRTVPRATRQSHGRSRTASRTKSTLATKLVLYKIKSVAKKSISTKSQQSPNLWMHKSSKFQIPKKYKIHKPQILHGRRRIQLTRVSSQLPKLVRRGTLPSRAGGRGDNGRRQSEPCPTGEERPHLGSSAAASFLFG